VYSKAFYNIIILWLLSSTRHWERWIYGSITRECRSGQLLHCAARKSTPRVLPALAQVYQWAKYVFLFRSVA